MESSNSEEEIQTQDDQMNESQLDQQNDSGPADDSSEAETVQAPWQPLTRRQRRVAGVLIEKSKTTPDNYPMSLNSVRVGSNQKSNRSPQMELQENEVEDILYELRGLGAVIEVHSGGRVAKFKHELYEWFGVTRVELAVLAELLLRGEQTLGDLRARASRMDKINGMSELKPIVADLIAKNLIVELTPPGRGQIVTHNVYQPEELERLKTQFGSYEAPERVASSPPPVSRPETNQPAISRGQDDEIAKLKDQIADLQKQLIKVQEDITELRSS